MTRDTERWFIHQGLPHLIDDYSVTTDVFTRAGPFFFFVYVVEAFLVLDEDRRGTDEILPFLGGVGVLIAALMVLNVFRGRKPWARPDRHRIGIPELAVFVLVPPLLPAIFHDDRLTDSTGTIVFNLVLVAGVYVVTSYGLIPMTRWAIGQMTRQFRDFAQLAGRALPLLLLFATFVFLNAELWQVCSDAPSLFFWFVVGLLWAIAGLFLLLRLPVERQQAGEFEQWEQVRQNLAGSPVADVDGARMVDPPRAPPLGRRARLNVALVLLFSQAVQIVLVTLLIGAFFTGFGLAAIHEDTILQWTTDERLHILADTTLFGHEVVFTWTLFRVIGFLCAFSALYFTVTTVTDANYREEFFDDLLKEVRRALAVRTVYVVALVGPDADDQEGASQRTHQA